MVDLQQMQCMSDIYRRMAAPFDVEDIREQIARCLIGLDAENVLHQDIILYGDAHDDVMDDHPPLRQDLRRVAPTRGRRYGRGYVAPHINNDDGDDNNHDDDNDDGDDDDDEEEEEDEDGGEEEEQPSSYIHSCIPAPPHVPYQYSTPTGAYIPTFDAPSPIPHVQPTYETCPTLLNSPIDWLNNLLGSDVKSGMGHEAGPSTQPPIEHRPRRDIHSRRCGTGSHFM
ncbi:unnamed protein product, partial [Cuscuta europaea]